MFWVHAPVCNRIPPPCKGLSTGIVSFDPIRRQAYDGGLRAGGPHVQGWEPYVGCTSDRDCPEARPPAGAAGRRPHSGPLRLRRRRADQPGGPGARAPQAARRGAGRRGRQRGRQPAANWAWRWSAAAWSGWTTPATACGRCWKARASAPAACCRVGRPADHHQDALRGPGPAPPPPAAHPRGRGGHPAACADADADRFAEMAVAAIKDVAAVCLEDYDKGLLSESLCQRIIDGRAARPASRCWSTPPGCSDYSKYRGATILTPNRDGVPAGLRLPRRLAGDHHGARAAALIEKYELGGLLVTLDREGCLLAMRGRSPVHIPTRPRAVYDNTGAGDAVLAMLAAARVAGANWEEAARLTNVAGGLEVEKFGCVPITRDEVLADLRLAGGSGGEQDPQPRANWPPNWPCGEAAARRRVHQRLLRHPARRARALPGAVPAAGQRGGGRAQFRRLGAGPEQGQGPPDRAAGPAGRGAGRPAERGLRGASSTSPRRRSSSSGSRRTCWSRARTGPTKAWSAASTWRPTAGGWCCCRWWKA